MSLASYGAGRLSRRAALRAGAGTGLGLAVGAARLGARPTRARASADQFVRVRWDLINYGPGEAAPADRIARPGGVASARAVTREKITMTGSGTFNDGNAGDVTGGGTYTIYDRDDKVLSKGNYAVTALLSWREAPGTNNPGVDMVADPATYRPGASLLAITYDDGADGFLLVSCHGTGTPDEVFEGIIASHGFSTFYNSEVAQGSPFIDANRTIFHVQ